MNKRKKGVRNQWKVAKYLESKGGIYHNQPIGGRFNTFKDIFHLWDGIWIDSNNTVIWVQVKSNNKPKLDKYQDWCNKYNQKGLIIVVKDRKGIVEYEV